MRSGGEHLLFNSVNNIKVNKKSKSKIDGNGKEGIKPYVKNMAAGKCQGQRRI
jgi:hypothetical protein